MAESTDLALKRFVAALIGLILGQVAGDKSIVVAKVFLYFWEGGKYELWRVTQASLIVILLTALIGVAVGAVMTKKGWVDANQLILSMATAIAVALFAIVDQSLPTPSGESKLPFEETVYYVIWFIALWLIPGVLQPNPDRSFARRIRAWGGLMAVLSLLAVVSWVCGELLTQLSIVLKKSLTSTNCGGANFGDPEKFWLANPSIVNPIVIALIMVAFFPVWCNTVWKNIRRFERHVWIVMFCGFGIIYTGLFGSEFYATRGWAGKLVGSNLAEEWQFFVAFGSIPASVMVVVATALLLTRTRGPVQSESGTGWPVSRAFWWLLPTGVALGFFAVVMLGFAPMARQDGACASEIWILAAVHGVNGIIFGSILSFSAIAIRRFQALFE